MSLAVITTIYQNYTVLADFLKTLEAQSDMDFHVFFIDVSTDKGKIPHTSVPYTVFNEENKGYAYGVNRGIAHAREKGFTQFAVVNNDITFDPHFIKNTKQSIQAHPGSIIGGKIYYAPGFEFHKKRYTEKDIGKVFWYAGGSIDWAHATAHHRGVDEVDTGQYDRLEETGFITGCLVCYDIAALEKVGEWDESYFLYYEDADFSVRAQRTGIKLYYDPSIIIWHKNAQSTDGSGSSVHARYQKKSWFKFGLKYAPLRTKLHLIKNYFV